MSTRRRVLLLAGASGLASVVYWISLPPLWVQRSQAGVAIHVENLGEYNSDLSQFVIKDLATGEVVVRFVPEHDQIAIWHLNLVAGRNDLLQDPINAKNSSYIIEVPAHSTVASLVEGRRYQVRVVSTPIFHLFRISRSAEFVI